MAIIFHPQNSFATIQLENCVKNLLVKGQKNLEGLGYPSFYEGYSKKWNKADKASLKTVYILLLPKRACQPFGINFYYACFLLYEQNLF